MGLKHYNTDERIACGQQGGALFFSASHQTELNTRSMTRRSIIVGIGGGEGRTRAEARGLLDYAGHRAISGMWAWWA